MHSRRARLLACLMSLWLAVGPAQVALAQTATSPAGLNQQIASGIIDQTLGQILPSTVRNILYSIVSTMSGQVGITPEQYASSPSDYGAICLASAHDDTLPVQASIVGAEALNGPGGRVVKIDGQCMTTASLSITATMTLECDSRANGIALNTTNQGVSIIKLGFQTGRLSNAKIKGCTFQREQTDPTGWAIDTLNTGNTTIEDVYLFGNNGTLGNGIRAANYFWFHATNVFVQNVAGSGYDLEGSTSSTAGAVGQINGLGTITGGSGGTNGTYYGYGFTGGTGTGATADFVVAGGAVTSITPRIPDSGGFTVGDTLSVSIPGLTGFSVPVTSVGSGSADFKLDGGSRVDGGTYGITEGDWVGGVYIVDDIFGGPPQQVAFKQTSTVTSHILDSYHFVGDDFDTVPTALLFVYASELHATGDRFGYNFTNAINISKGRDVTVVGSNFIDCGGNCIFLSSAQDGVNFVKSGVIAGDMFDGGAFAINLGTGTADVDVGNDSLVGQASYGITTGCVANITIGVNSFDSSIDNGPYSIGCGGSSSSINWGAPPITGEAFANLPSCTSTTSGLKAYITDASAAITAWHQAVTTGGGTNPAFIECDGSGWHAYDF